MVTREAILQVAPAAAKYVDDLLLRMRLARIVHPDHPTQILPAAHFLGQIYVESGGFKQVVESLNYSTKALISKFGRHRISLADAKKFGRNDDHPAHQNALANILYGGDWGEEHLGNTQPGDGWRFRGRGLKQLTGRDNYTRFSLWARGTDEYVAYPDKVALPDGAVRSAIWFWLAEPQLQRLALRDDVAGVTREVNGGENGLDDRVRWTRAFKAAFQL